MDDEHGLPPVALPKRLLGDHVFHLLGAAIVEGRIPEGRRILDVDLARELNVSRTPVREALQRLERIGLVEMLPSRSTRVTFITDESIRMSRVYAGYQAGFATHESVSRLTDQERQDAARLIDDVIAAIGDLAAASAARRALFSYLSERSGNPIHHAHMSDMQLAFQRNLARAPLIDASREQAWQQLVDLRSAILAGDGTRAERLVRAQHGIDGVPPAS